MLSKAVQSEADRRAERLQPLVSPQSFSEFQLQTRLPGCTLQILLILVAENNRHRHLQRPVSMSQMLL